MRLTKRTYTLPPETLDRFEQAVEPGRRSALIAGLIQEWLDEREREALRRDIEEGCREMAEVYLEIEREWHPLDEELWRAIDY